MPSINVSESITVGEALWVLRTGSPSIPFPINIYFDCEGGREERGVFYVDLDLDGTIPFFTMTDSPIDLFLELDGTAALGVLSTGELDIFLNILGDVYLIPSKMNFVMWSNIGEMNFTVGRDNVAGESPMEWRGYIYKVKKLQDKVVVYGQNGIALLVPFSAGVVGFGRRLISTTGLISKDAIAGTDDVHFFLNKAGMLWRVTPPGSLELLDYREFLSKMNNRTVLSYDAEKELLYICDGVRGYVLSKWGLGEGPVNITGLGRRTDSFYIVSPNVIEIDPFEICTDIIDLGSRNIKTIYQVDLGTETNVPIYVAVDYRYDSKTDFTTTAWFRADDAGSAFFTVSGVEFRFRVKLLWRNELDLDYIRVFGKDTDKGERPQ